MEEIAEEDREARAQTEFSSALHCNQALSPRWCVCYYAPLAQHVRYRDKEREEIDLRKLAEYERLFRQLGTVIDECLAKISVAGDTSC